MGRDYGPRGAARSFPRAVCSLCRSPEVQAIEGRDEETGGNIIDAWHDQTWLGDPVWHIAVVQTCLCLRRNGNNWPPLAHLQLLNQPSTSNLMPWFTHRVHLLIKDLEHHFVSKHADAMEDTASPDDSGCIVFVERKVTRSANHTLPIHSPLTLLLSTQ